MFYEQKQKKKKNWKSFQRILDGDLNRKRVLKFLCSISLDFFSVFSKNIEIIILLLRGFPPEFISLYPFTVIEQWQFEIFKLNIA